MQNKQGSYVIVEKGGGSFQARPVVLGLVNKGRVEVQAGLKEGEMVVTSGQFLIDSESSLRESFQKMQKMSAGLSELKLNNEQMVLINHMLESGLYIHEQLAEKNLPSPDIVSTGAKAAAKLLPEVEGTRLAYIAKDTVDLLSDIQDKITLSDWRDLLAKLTETLEPWVAEGKPDYYRDLGIALFTTETGEHWLQFAGDGKNPYADSAFSEIVLGAPQQDEGEQDGQQ